MKGWIAIGVAVLVHTAAFSLALARVDPIYTDFYNFAWWTYLFFLAGVNHLFSRSSLLLDQPREALWVCFYSTLVWLFFELFNLRLNNWDYVGVPLEIYLRWPGYFVAYGTVLPGIFETETALRNLGLARNFTAAPLKISAGVCGRLPLIGYVMMALVLIFPEFCFPLVWLGMIFILDPLVYRYEESHSFLGKAARGDYSLLVRLLAAGLICGFLWEFWNHWAGAKWVYALPYFEYMKIFEMPALGFLGFPPFALQCYLFYRAFLIFRRRFLCTPGRARVLTAVLVALYCILAFLAIDRLTIVSYKEMLGA